MYHLPLCAHPLVTSLPQQPEPDPASERPAPATPPVLPGSGGGTLRLALRSVQLEGGSDMSCFAIFKCGPYWGRSSPITMTCGLSSSGRRDLGHVSNCWPVGSLRCLSFLIVWCG